MTTQNTRKETVLERLHKKSISAKDIANQFWCEKQMELNYVSQATPTAAMNRGSAIHAQLQVQVYKPLSVEPVSWPDRMYKQAYENILSLNTLAQERMAREIKIYGSINGYTVAGQIDEIRMADGKAVIVETKTTTSSKFTPEYTRPHVVQIMLYRKMLQELVDGSYGYRNLDALYRMQSMRLSEGFAAGLREIGVKEELMTVGAVYTRMFAAMASLPQLSDALVLHYVNRKSGEDAGDITVDYDREKLGKDITYALGYWNGEREASPVAESDRWKCNICRFYGKQCTVWYQGA